MNIEFRTQVSLPFHCAKIHPCSGIRKTGVIGWFPYWTLGFLYVPLNVLADINTKAKEEFCRCVCATTLLRYQSSVTVMPSSAGTRIRVSPFSMTEIFVK